MCRSASSKGGKRRCPSHSDQAAIAKRNARRRQRYAERNNSTGVTSPQDNLSISPFASAVKMMSLDTAKILIASGNYEDMPFNAHVKRLYDEDGNCMLYLPAENSVEAVSEEVFDLGMGYRLPYDKVMGEYRTTPHLRAKLQEAIDNADVMDQSHYIREILFSNYRSVNAGVEHLMSDPETASEVRQRFFNHFGHEEQVIRNDDGSLAGYAYAYRPKTPLGFDQLNPSLVVTEKEEGFSDYLWSKNIIESYQDEDDYDALIRDDYFTTMENAVRKHGYVKKGAYRMVFDRGDTVIKIPLNSQGLTDNSREFMHSQGKGEDYHKGVPIASSHMEYTDRGLPYLVMEKVDMVDLEDHEFPAWAKKIDANQLGRSRVTGKLVAYDL